MLYVGWLPSVLNTPEVSFFSCILLSPGFPRLSQIFPGSFWFLEPSVLTWFLLPRKYNTTSGNFLNHTGCCIRIFQWLAAFEGPHSSTWFCAACQFKPLSFSCCTSQKQGTYKPVAIWNCKVLLGQKSRVELPGAGVPGHCELASIDAENWIPVLWKISKSKARHLSRPLGKRLTQETSCKWVPLDLNLDPLGFRFLFNTTPHQKD